MIDRKRSFTMKSTPFVRQYAILKNKWGALHMRMTLFFAF